MYKYRVLLHFNKVTYSRYRPVDAASRWRESEGEGRSGDQEVAERRNTVVVEEKAPQEEGSWGSLFASVGFFGLVIPTVLGGMLYLGVPVAQVRGPPWQAFLSPGHVRWGQLDYHLLGGGQEPGRSCHRHAGPPWSCLASSYFTLQFDSLARSGLVWVLEVLDSMSEGGRVS